MWREADRTVRSADVSSLPSIQISERSRCDLELLPTGGFSPLDRFLSRADEAQRVFGTRNPMHRAPVAAPEAPLRAELTIETVPATPEANAEAVVSLLASLGLVHS